MRFEQEMSQTQIAAAIGISQMHVSRLLLKSLARLHDDLSSEAALSNSPATRGGRRRSPVQQFE
jgi:predicted XRE-type DNA-binding protein